MNPNSSKGRGARYEEKILKCFSRHGLSVEFAHTEYRDHAIKLTREGIERGFGTIVACGGDGTVNEVVNGIMVTDRSVRMGIIPLGRGNDFAWSAGIPDDIEKAVELLSKAERIGASGCGHSGICCQRFDIRCAYQTFEKIRIIC